jgi:hypothetical protein
MLVKHIAGKIWMRERWGLRNRFLLGALAAGHCHRAGSSAERCFAQVVRENVIKVYALKIDCVKAVPRLRR